MVSPNGCSKRVFHISSPKKISKWDLQTETWWESAGNPLVFPMPLCLSGTASGYICDIIVFLISKTELYQELSKKLPMSPPHWKLREKSKLLLAGFVPQFSKWKSGILADRLLRDSWRTPDRIQTHNWLQEIYSKIALKMTPGLNLEILFEDIIQRPD